MKRRVWISLFLILLVLISALFVFRMCLSTTSEKGFSIVLFESNTLLLTDADISSYNWTSQEMIVSSAASQRLLGIGDSLYKFSAGFVIKIDGEEIYRGAFRTAYMSAIPALPKISILFPSISWPSGIENTEALMMFYPSGKPPIEQQEANAKLSQYFEKANKLTY